MSIIDTHQTNFSPENQEKIKRAKQLMKEIIVGRKGRSLHPVFTIKKEQALLLSEVLRISAEHSKEQILPDDLASFFSRVVKKGLLKIEQIDIDTLLEEQRKNIGTLQSLMLKGSSPTLH